ncbi:unnamed protein product [Closterium sp. NIES-53]
MSPKDQTPEPRVLTSSSRVSCSLFLLLVTIPLLFLLHILVLRYSCLAPAAWTAAIESDSQDELKPVAAAIDAIEPLAGLRGSMDDSEADLGGMEEAEAPRGMDEAEPRRMDERLRGMDEGLRGMDEGSRGMDEGSRGMDEPGSRGMVDAERGADRLRYPGRKRVLGFVGVFTNFASRERRALLRETWFPATPEEHARVEAATGLVFRFIIGHGWSAEDEQLLQAENSTHGDLLRIEADEAYLNLNHTA